MSTSPPVQVPSTSIDTAGLSTLTSPRSFTDSRAGLMYNPSTWAASAPVGFYPMADGTFIEFASQVWTAATVSSTDPKSYSAHTASTVPSWIICDPRGSTATPLGGSTIPTNTPNTGRTLTAVWPKPPVFYLLNTMTTSSATIAVLQYFRLTYPDHLPQLVIEETLPTALHGSNTVRFDRGVYVVEPYVYVFGADIVTGAVFVMRKPSGKININKVTGLNPQSSQPQIQNTNWAYKTASGWSHDATQAVPIVTATGTLTTNGPMSVAMNHSTTFLSTVTNSSGTYTANVLASRGAQDPWRVLGTAPLGSTGYTGGTLQFVPLLQAITTPANSLGAIPYVISTIVSGSGVSSLGVSWNTWPVPLNS